MIVAVVTAVIVVVSGNSPEVVEAFMSSIPEEAGALVPVASVTDSVSETS